MAWLFRKTPTLRPCPNVGCSHVSSGFAKFCPLCGRSVMGDFTPMRHLLESGVTLDVTAVIWTETGQCFSCDSYKPERVKGPRSEPIGFDPGEYERAVRELHRWITMGFTPRLQQRGIAVYSPSLEVHSNERPCLFCDFNKTGLFDSVCCFSACVAGDFAFANPNRIEHVQVLTEFAHEFLKLDGQKQWLLDYVAFFIDDLSTGGSGN